MKELASNIRSSDIKLNTINDNGHWYNSDIYGKNGKNQHRIDIIYNGTSEKDKIEANKFAVSAYRHGREKFDVTIKNNGHEITIHELQKTKRDKEIIYDRISAVNCLIRSFGFEPSPYQDLKRFHILKPQSVEIFSKGVMLDGFFDPFGHCISVDRSPSDIETATTVGHEELHSKSPTIIQKVNEEMLTRRRGLMTSDMDGQTHLVNIDEATNSDLNYYLYKTTIQNNPIYEEEMSKVRKIKPWIKEIITKQAAGEIMLSENIYLEDIYTVRGPVLEILESGRSKDYKIAYLTNAIENPKEDCKLVTFERSDEVKYFTEVAHKIIAGAKSKGQMIFPNDIVIWFAWLKFAPNDEFFEKREALKAKIDGYMGEGFFETIK